jgi:5'-nucleotidase
MAQPLILVTNDDGIAASGLWAVVEAVLPLGDVLVVAPNRQWSGGGRSMPPDVTGSIEVVERVVAGRALRAYAVDASPALAVVHGVTELVDRVPDLVVSGINNGANVSIEVTVSGTVGAALEAAAFGIPALAVSLEMDPVYHLTGKDDVDYSASIAFTRRFAACLLSEALPYDMDVLNVNVPVDGTPETPWWLTHLSRCRYFTPQAPDRERGQGRPGCRVIADPGLAERDSDIWALLGARVVSATPLSLDMTSRVNFDVINHCLRDAETLKMPVPSSLPMVEVPA